MLLLLAIAFNYPFAKRRYPLPLHIAEPKQEQSQSSKLGSADVEYALEQFDVVVDISPDELKAIAELAIQHADQTHTRINLKGRPITWLDK